MYHFLLEFLAPAGAYRAEGQKVETKIDQLMERIIESDSPTLIQAYEKQVRKLERQKVEALEKARRCETKSKFRSNLSNRLNRKPIQAFRGAWCLKCGGGGGCSPQRTRLRLISLLYRELTGKTRKFGPIQQEGSGLQQQTQGLAGKFPRKLNREIFFAIREIIRRNRVRFSPIRQRLGKGVSCKLVRSAGHFLRRLSILLRNNLQ